MIPRLRPLLAVAALAWPLVASAQTPPKMRPGLWEHGFSMASQSGELEAAMKQMQQQMASLPPDQRKMMQDMMAKQGVGIGPGGNTVKLCLSKEDAERDSPTAARRLHPDRPAQRQCLAGGLSVQGAPALQRRRPGDPGEPDGLFRQFHHPHGRAWQARAVPDEPDRQVAVGRLRQHPARAVRAVSGRRGSGRPLRAAPA